MKPKSIASGQTLNPRQEAALKTAEEAFTAIVRRGYAAGLDAAWLQLALWHATDRVEQLATTTVTRKTRSRPNRH